MTNALDYIKQKGSLSFSEEPFNEVDMLMFSMLVYAAFENHGRSFIAKNGTGPTLLSLLDTVYPEPLPKNASYVFRPRYESWQLMKDHRRFAEVRLDRFLSNFEPENDKQFAAAVFCCDVKGVKVAIVSFRGTDSTVTGWKEDFDMAYKNPIPAQADAVAFLESVLVSGYDKVYVCGHSKGGNLAMYSSAFVERQEAIEGIYNYDGPGLSEEIIESERWINIRKKVHSFIPESSIIGMLLGHCTEPMVVKSDSKSIMQHNPFYWHIDGTGFVQSDDLTFSSRFLDGTLHKFIESCTLEQKETLVSTTFEIIEISQAVKVRDIAKGLALRLPEVQKTISKIPEEDRKIIREVLRILVGSGSKTALLLLEKKD